MLSSTVGARRSVGEGARKDVLGPPTQSSAEKAIAFRRIDGTSLRELFPETFSEMVPGSTNGGHWV